MKTRMLAFLIEWNWHFIVRGRQRAAKLCNSIAVLRSPKMRHLFAKLDERCEKVMILTNRFEWMTGEKENQVFYFKRPAA